jgi:hypothetical protein
MCQSNVVKVYSLSTHLIVFSFFLKVRNVWSSQVAAASNSYAWDLVYKSDVRELIYMVQKRPPCKKRVRYGEKLDEQVSPFQSLEQLDGIEDWLWREREKGKRAGLVSLRTRFALLM